MAVILMFPTVALASGTSVQAVSAKLVAGGAAINVTVSFTCPAGDVVADDQHFTNNGLGVYVQQAVGTTQQAFGRGDTGGQTCTGSPQTAEISLFATAPGPPFHRGRAAATANLVECDPTFSTCTRTKSGITTIWIHR
jgi:hypothetical protein